MPRVPLHFTTKLVCFCSKLKFPKAAQRFTDAQLQHVRASRYLMPTVLVDKRGLVLANFAGALIANRTVFGETMLIIHESDLAQTKARKFARALTTLALKNKWDQDILDIELQYLRKLI
jgi:hypothetical protein